MVQYAGSAVWLDTEGAGLENWPNVVFLSLKLNVGLVLPLPYHTTMAYPGILFGGGVQQIQSGQRAERTGIWGQ
jgi:hypothetical protein